MIESHELKNRNRYLKKLIGFQDTEPVKVITGIRRCGKSSLLKLMIRHLRETSVQAEQIVEMNFESHDFWNMTSDEIYHYVKERVIPGRRMYLFFDELQRINAWEDAVNSFQIHKSPIRSFGGENTSLKLCDQPSSSQAMRFSDLIPS